MTGAAAIDARDLDKRYGTRVGISGLSLSVPEGSVFGFLGPNGAGKTTLIRVLLGFLRADAGEARMLERDCWRDSHVIKRDVGYVPGDLRLPEWMDGQNALQIVGKARGRDLSRGGAELAEELDLDLTVRVRAMSRGMRQKLGLILALAHDPRLLVLDEPTTALDPLTQDNLSRRLRAMARDGHTVFFSSHVLSEVENLCERVAIVRRGEIVADERLEAMRARAARRVTIRWREGAAPEQAPEFLDVVERGATTWRCELEGSAGELVAWLQGRAVQDLEIGPPELDTLFRRYYDDREPAV